MAIKHKQLMRSIELAHVQTREGAVLTLRTFANFILCMQGTKCDNYVELIILIWQGFCHYTYWPLYCQDSHFRNKMFKNLHSVYLK